MPISHFTDLTLYTQQEMDEYLGNFLSSDLNFFPLQKPAILPAAPISLTNLVNTF